MMKTTVLLIASFMAAGSPGAALAQKESTAQEKPARTPKIIRDQVEFNAYITALNTQDPAEKAAAMETFADQYPYSTVLVEALEQAMAAYQQAHNQPRLEKVAHRILQVDPDHVRALAIITFIKRQNAFLVGFARRAAQLGFRPLGPNFSTGYPECYIKGTNYQLWPNAWPMGWFFFLSAIPTLRHSSQVSGNLLAPTSLNQSSRNAQVEGTEHSGTAFQRLPTTLTFLLCS